MASLIEPRMLPLTIDIQHVEKVLSFMTNLQRHANRQGVNPHRMLNGLARLIAADSGGIYKCTELSKGNSPLCSFAKLPSRFRSNSAENILSQFHLHSSPGTYNASSHSNQRVISLFTSSPSDLKPITEQEAFGIVSLSMRSPESDTLISFRRNGSRAVFSTRFEHRSSDTSGSTSISLQFPSKQQGQAIITKTRRGAQWAQIRIWRKGNRQSAEPQSTHDSLLYQDIIPPLLRLKPI